MRVMRCTITLRPLLSALFLLAAGCSSVGSSAVRTDGLAPRAQVGPVRVYAIAAPPGARVIGVVEVHAINEEANIEKLMPVFLTRVAQLGGSGGVVDHVLTGYEWRTEMRMESYSYPCGYRGTCMSSRMVPYTYEVRFLTIQGRALVPDNVAPPQPQPTITAPPQPTTVAPTPPAPPKIPKEETF